MKRAWELVRTAGETISSGLKKAWKEAKEVENEVKNAVVESFMQYNARRYSLPWICKMGENGAYDFGEKIGCYTGTEGEEGNLIVFDPVIGQVYGWGQKDYRGNNTIKKFAKWNGVDFDKCDKMGELC